MVYDNTLDNRPDYAYENSAERGYAIHENSGDPVNGEYGEHRYSLYTDDGRGNGDYIAGSSDIYWIRRIAFALDAHDASEE